jgi:hypothetical protein
MRRTPQRLLPVSLLLLLPMACAPGLRLAEDVHPAYVDDLRAEYLKRNPQSPYLEQVARGEVVKGMDVFGVLAAWGHPERRSRDDPQSEHWVYIDTDPGNGDVTEYMLAFKQGVLSAWQTHRFSPDASALRDTDDGRAVSPPGARNLGKKVPNQQ